MFAQEEWLQHVDDEHTYNCGRSDVYETYTDNPGKLFRDYQREYGRCISKVYIDTPDGKATPIGWVFQKREKFDSLRPGDPASYYILETWVTLHKSKPMTKTTYDFQPL